MGRKKKHFIEKKKSVTFSLVHRSQRDPLINETGEAQMVLASQLLSRDDQLKEQEKYGIHYQDEYDYLQHLKEPVSTQTTLLENKRKVTSFLPPELFGSEVETLGAKLDKVVPLTGPQVGWDPDILASLDNDNEEDEEFAEPLEDDFILLANGGEPGLPVYVQEEEMPDTRGQPWWMERNDFKTSRMPVETDESDDSADLDYDEDKSHRFTNYSMTSADVPRSEGLSLLDERFEEFMLEYEDDQIGPLEETAEQNVGDIENVVLKSAVDEFFLKHKSSTRRLTELETEQDPLVNEREEESETEELEERMLIQPEEHWDCETILSTYSNLFNHPTLIKDPPKQKTQVDKSRDLSAVHPNSEHSTDVNKVSQAPIHRPRNELPEDKRARKHAIKEERKIRRSEKKASRQYFKQEQIKLEKQLTNNPLRIP